MFSTKQKEFWYQMTQFSIKKNNILIKDFDVSCVFISLTALLQTPCISQQYYYFVGVRAF